LDQNLRNKYKCTDLLLLHHTYDHTPNALVLPPSTAVGNIDVDKRRPAGLDGPDKGGHDAPPPRR
jgi:hypothetical protein